MNTELTSPFSYLEHRFPDTSLNHYFNLECPCAPKVLTGKRSQFGFVLFHDWIVEHEA